MIRRTPTIQASTEASASVASRACALSRSLRASCIRALGSGFVVGGVLATSGCASRYEVTKLGNVVVHTITHDNSNMHVVVEDGHAFAVDSGTTATAGEMETDLRTIGIPPESLRAIVVTHGHYDHVGGARFFQRKFGTKIVAGRADLRMMERGTNDPICPVGFLARSRHAYDSAQTFEPVVPDVIVDERTSLLALTGVHAVVIPLASHTPGSITVIAGRAALARCCAGWLCLCRCGLEARGHL